MVDSKIMTILVLPRGSRYPVLKDFGPKNRKWYCFFGTRNLKHWVRGRSGNHAGVMCHWAVYEAITCRGCFADLHVRASLFASPCQTRLLFTDFAVSRI